MLKNKRGDIPVTILVIGVFGICVLAILSFNFSLSSKDTFFVGPYLIEDVASISEQIIFYNDKGVNFDSLLSKIKTTGAYSDLKITQNQDKSYLIREEFKTSGAGIFSNSVSELVFSVEYPFTP